MKIKNRLVSAMLSLVTGLSMLSLLPPTLVSAAGLSYDKVVDWSETTYNYINGTDTGTGIINGVTSLSVNNGQKKYNSETRTGLKSNWNDIFKSGYTFNFEKNVKPDDMTIVLFQQDNQGNWVKSYDVPLNDDFLNKINELNQKVNEICGTDGQEYFVDYSTDENKGKYYGVDEPQREVTRKALWTIDSNTGELFQDKKVETKTGYSAFDSRSFISIGHDVKRDYFIKLPDADKCKIGMLYKNGGSQLNENGVPELLDVLVYCNDYDFLNEAVPYMSSSNVVDKSANGDEDYAYLTDEMVELLIANGLAESEFSLEDKDAEHGVEHPIYRRLPNPISKRYVIMGKENELKALTENGNPPSIYDKTYYGVREYNYVIPYYMISHVTNKTIPYAGSIRYNGDVVERIVPLRNGNVTVNWDGIEVNAFELIERQSYDDYYVYGNLNALKWRNSWVNYHITDITTSCFRYTEGKPGISVGFGTWFDIRHEFYMPGAYNIESPNFRDNRINVKGYSCWKDVDEQQGVSFLKNGAVQDEIINSNGRSIIATGAWIGDETGHSSMYGCHAWSTVESPSEKPLLYTASDIVDEKDKSKIGFLKPTDKSYIGRYDWSNEFGQQLMGYFDYSTQNAIPEETESNWLFATFDTSKENDIYGNATSQLQLYYTFWGAVDGSYNKLIESCENQTNCQSRFNAFSSGWMMCDFPTIRRTFTANYRFQKTVKDENGREVPIIGSQYGSSPDNPSFDIGFVLTDADGKVCIVRKLDEGKYAYVKTLDTTDLTECSELMCTNDKNNKYSTLKGIVTLTNLPRGEYRIVEAVVTHKQDNNEQPIPVSKMIFSDPLATGNQFGKQLSVTTTFTPANSSVYGAATASVDEHGNVSVTYKGDTINLKTTAFDVSALLDFAKDEQDYISIGGTPMIDKDGNQQISSTGAELKVNSRITNETEVYTTSLKVKKIAKDVHGNDVSNKNNTCGIVFNLEGQSVMGDEIKRSATTNANGYATFTDLPIGRYTVTEDPESVSKLPYDEHAPFGWECDLTPKEAVIAYGEEKEPIKFTNTTFAPNTGTIEIVKKDANNAQKLQGAEFTLYDSNKVRCQKYDPAITSDAGVAAFEDLERGLYYIKETKAPEGYVINDTYYPVEITDETLIANNGILKLDIENSLIRGSIKLTKVNSEKTGMKLSGATFRVYKDVDGDGKYKSEVDTAFGTMSENNGVYSTSANVPYGKYLVKEIKAPEGYVLDTNYYPVSITENGKAHIVSNIEGTALFGNPLIKGSIKVIKVNSEKTGMKLSGAIFRVYKDVDGDGRYDSDVDTAFGTMSENNGVYSTSANVPYGKYLVKEIKAPEGYVLDTNYYPVSITENGKAHIVSNIEGTELLGNVPIKGSIKVTKVDSDDTDLKLSGAIFRVYKDVDGDGKYDGDVDTAFGTMSENNGVYSTSANVPYGKYIVREVKAPTGYYQDTKDYPVNITEDGKVYVVSNIPNTKLFGNKPKPVSITLTKRIPVDEVNGDIWFEHGNPTFILKLVNTTSGENYNRTFYKAVEFTKEYVKSNAITVDGKKYVEMSVTYDNMPAGTFTASEAVVGQRYQLKELLNIVNGVVNDSVINFTLKPGENGATTFYNVKSSFDTNTHNSLCVNVLKR